MFIEHAQARDNAVRLNFNNVWPEIKTTKKDAAKAVLEDALAFVPPELFTPNGDTIKKLLDKALSVNGETFEKLFGSGPGDTKFEPIRKDGLLVPLASGSDGMVYPVKVIPHPKGVAANVEFVMKVFRPTANPDETPFETEVQKELANYEPQMFDAKNRFVPIVAGSGTAVAQPPGQPAVRLNYIVMERTGITLWKWRNLVGENTPTKDEMMRMITRTYFIMKSFHQLGYRHGDCHENNWALSRTNNKVIFLFDFGRTRPMFGKAAKGDYMWMARDWWCWLTVVEAFEPEIEKQTPVPDAYPKLQKLIPLLKAQMAKLLWFRPDNDYDNAPFFGLNAKTNADAMDLPEFKKFTELAEKFFEDHKIKSDGGLKSGVQLYRWKPAPDSKKKRDIPANPKFSHAATAAGPDEE